MRVETDPLREIDDLLDRWAYYRRRANAIPTGHTGSELTKLYREAAEIQAGSARVKRARTLARRIRGVLGAQVTEHKRLAEQYQKAGDEWTAATHQIKALRLMTRIMAEPVTTQQLPLASMIHGSGYRRDDDDDQEEAVNRIVLQMPRQLREVLERNYLNDLPQDENARQMRISRRTFQTRLTTAKWELKRRLEM